MSRNTPCRWPHPVKGGEIEPATSNKRQQQQQQQKKKQENYPKQSSKFEDVLSCLSCYNQQFMRFNDFHKTLYEYKLKTRILGRSSDDIGVGTVPLLCPIQQMPFNRAEASLQILLNMKSVWFSYQNVMLKWLLRQFISVHMSTFSKEKDAELTTYCEHKKFHSPNRVLIGSLPIWIDHLIYTKRTKEGTLNYIAFTLLFVVS